jgi:hypothetical protein
LLPPPPPVTGSIDGGRSNPDIREKGLSRAGRPGLSTVRESDGNCPYQVKAVKAASDTGLEPCRALS